MNHRFASAPDRRVGAIVGYAAHPGVDETAAQAGRNPRGIQCTIDLNHPFIKKCLSQSTNFFDDK